MQVRNRANPAFRQAAPSVAKSDAACGVDDRAMRARLGPRQAMVATAHTMARTGDQLVKTGDDYQEERTAADTYKRQERARKQ